MCSLASPAHTSALVNIDSWTDGEVLLVVATMALQSQYCTDVYPLPGVALFGASQGITFIAASHFLTVYLTLSLEITSSTLQH